MRRTQIYLSEEQAKRLDASAEAVGRTRSDLIREAIQLYLETPPARTREAREAAIDAAFGIWAGKSAPLKAIRQSRAELNARFEQTSKRMQSRPKHK